MANFDINDYLPPRRSTRVAAKQLDKNDTAELIGEAVPATPEELEEPIIETPKKKPAVRKRKAPAQAPKPPPKRARRPQAIETPPEEIPEQSNAAADDVRSPEPAELNEGTATPQQTDEVGGDMLPPTPQSLGEDLGLATPPASRPKRRPEPIQRYADPVDTTEAVEDEIGDEIVVQHRSKKPNSTKDTPVRKATAKPATPSEDKKPTSSKKTPASKATTKPETPSGSKKQKQKQETISPAVSSPWMQIDTDAIDRFSELATLSKQLTERKPVAEKFLPTGAPYVWAESRQALCETLPYFKKPQGGCYQNDGHVYGFLFDGLGHCREYVSTDVIICRAGGSMETEGTGMVQGKDQTFKEAQVQAVLNDIEHKNPVVVICGNRNEAALVRMPHLYCVLDWYKPVMAWSEKTTGKGGRQYTTVKYRLERLNRHRPAWHAPTGMKEITDEEKQLAGTLYKKKCADCSVESLQVYLRGWTCLNADCESFWEYESVSLPTGTDLLEYNPAFLLQNHGHWNDTEDEHEPTDLRPPIPEVDSYTLGDNLAYINTRGICCDKCGRCTPRRFFHGWICENPSCDRQVLPKHQIIKPEMLHTPWDNAPTLLRNMAPTLLRGENPGIELKVTHKFGYKIATYRFHGMGIEGSFIHAAPTKEILKLPREANDMFAALQTEDMGLERRVFAVQKMGGKGNDDAQKPEDAPEMGIEDDDAAAQTLVVPDKKYDFAPGDLMTAFSMNYGMPYKFVATGASKPFSDAPWPVSQCRRMLNWAQANLLEETTTAYKDFNEELIFAYLQGQKIEYHDDGEEGLGPRIASISLGSRAKMHLRLKMKHYVGCSKTGLFTEEKPVKGGHGGPDQDAARLLAWNELQAAKRDDPTTYRALRTEIPKRLDLPRMKKAEDLVTVSLSHGDIMIMDGYDVQRYLEHKVVPEGCFRFALTCRTVLPSHLKAEEMPAYAVDADACCYGGPGV